MSITQTVGGVDVTISIVKDNENETITVTFQAPPGTVGHTQTVKFDSNVTISSVEAENGCIYSLTPKSGLDWEDVVNVSQVQWLGVCQA